MTELLTKLLTELSAEVNVDVLCYIHSLREGSANGTHMFGIHSGAKGECSNNIHMFLFGIHSGSEGECSNNIHMFLFGLHSMLEEKYSNDMRMFVWYTFGIRRGVLEYYTTRNMNE